MKFIDEFRDNEAVQNTARFISSITKHPWTLMEICGGQTHTIVKFGIESVLPDAISLVHGPGCPVCVTPLETIDRAVAIASLPGVLLASFGDMLRVPGSSKDLLSVKAEGGDVRIVYSPLDALTLARDNPGKRVVFLAVGFETTAPANAMAVWQASRLGIGNFSILSSHVLVPPAIDTILSDPENSIQGILAAGHVCAVMGVEEYILLSDRFHIPVVVTGFEPLDILQGVALCVRMLEEGRPGVRNQYSRAVRREGNPDARRLMDEVFEVADRQWRGLGEIPRSGYRLREKYAGFDAEKIFPVEKILVSESPHCRAGEVLRGKRRPFDCPAFGGECTPEHPLGALMVSSEGSCAAYYRYARTGKGVEQ